MKKSFIGLKTVLIILFFIGIVSCNKNSDKNQKIGPNILYIFTDDQSIRTVSSYPSSYQGINTPNIDRLATEGMLFTNSYSGAWCVPSRATALTGLHPHGIKSLNWVGNNPDQEYNPEVLRFWPSVFRKSGYYTGIIGKWHTGADDGAGRDWDYSAIWNHSMPEVYGGYYLNQKISFNGADPVSVGGYSIDNYTDYALDFVNNRSAKKGQPWFLWLCYDAPHGPFISSERHEDMYKDIPPVTVPADIYPPRPTKPSHMVNYNRPKWEKDDNGKPKARVGDQGTGKNVTLDEAVQRYNRPVLALDEGIGKIIKALELTKQLDNTLVVFTSDNGFAFGQHGFIWKYAPYDGTNKVPLIIRWPEKISQNKVCEHPVGGHDLIPTFFSVAGIDLPWEMHGHDISPMFEDPNCQWEHPLLIENTQRLFGEDTNRDEFPIYKEIPCWVFLRDGKYKYIRYLIENEIEELYDLDADPEELTNLALSPDYRKLLVNLRNKSIKELKRTDAGFVDKLPTSKTELN